MKIFAVIPAGGKGSRSGYTVPKQFIKADGKELIVYTLEVFQKNRLINEIAVAADKKYHKLINKLKLQHGISKLKYIVEGGRERQDSVFNALSSLNAESDDLVVVHDAARPLLPQNVLNNAIYTARLKGNAVVCIKAKDTLVKGNATITDFIDRSEVFYVQTPQIFHVGVLTQAMKKAEKDNFTGTDESMIVKRLGKKIHITEGSPLNFKVTTREDVTLVKKLLSII